MKQRRGPRRRGTPVWTELEWAEATVTLLRRSKGLCECCGTPLRGRAERSHRVARRYGGDRLSNLLLVLPEHHHRMHQSPDWARSHGFHRFHGDEPTEHPVHWRGKVWVLLDDDGTMTPCDPPADFLP